MSIWKKKCSEESKPWGTITNLRTPFGMHGKIIYIDKGKRNSLKYYTQLNQCLFCMSGKVIVTAPDEFEFGDKIHDAEGASFELNPGNLILIQAGSPYRVTAVEDSVLVEVLLGAYSEKFVMLDDDYGRVE